MANEPTLSEALRLAADLIDAIGWDHSITWSSTNDLGLHMREGSPDPTDAIVGRGASLLEHARQIGEDYELDRTTWAMPDGLTVTVYGQSEPIGAE